MRAFSLLVIAGLSTLLPVSGTAQEFPTLEQAMQNGADESYPLVRCAAFHFSVMRYVGINNMDAEVVAGSKAALQDLMTQAVLVRMQQTDASLETATEDIQRDVFGVAGIYIERYRKNYAEDEQAFTNDPVWMSDASMCQLLTEASNG